MRLLCAFSKNSIGDLLHGSYNSREPCRGVLVHPESTAASPQISGERARMALCGRATSNGRLYRDRNNKRRLEAKLSAATRSIIFSTFHIAIMCQHDSLLRHTGVGLSFRSKVFEGRIKLRQTRAQAVFVEHCIHHNPTSSINDQLPRQWRRSELGLDLSVSIVEVGQGQTLLFEVRGSFVRVFVSIYGDQNEPFFFPLLRELGE